MQFLNQFTLVPLGLAVISIGGGAAWLTSLHISTQANADTLRVVSERQYEYNRSVTQIQKDIAEIKGELKRIKK